MTNCSFMYFWLVIFLFSCSSVVVIGQNQPDQSRQTEIQLHAAPQYSEEVCSLAIMKANCHVFGFFGFFGFCFVDFLFHFVVISYLLCLVYFLLSMCQLVCFAFPCPSLVVPGVLCVPASVPRASLVCALFNFFISLSCFLWICPCLFLFCCFLFRLQLYISLLKPAFCFPPACL